jgi:ankyrin repeat protein
MRTHAGTVRDLAVAIEGGSDVRLPDDIDARDESGLSFAQWALNLQEPQVLRLLLERGAYLEPEHRLAAGVVCGDVERVGAHGVDLDQVDRFNRTPLMYAVDGRQLALIDLLLDSGADPEVPNVWGGNILDTATWDPDPEVIARLIRGGAQVNRPNKDGDTPLLRVLGPWRDSLSPAFVDSARLLIEGGASLYYRASPPREERCALCSVVDAYQVFSDGHAAVLDILLAAGGRELIHGRGTPALRVAAYRGYARAVEALLDAGVSPDTPEEPGRSPVAISVRHGHAEVLAALLRRGAHVPAVDDRGRSLLRQARAAADPRLAALLAPYPLSTNHPPSPAGLADAIAADDVAAVREVLDAGVDPNADLPGEGTPMIHAARLGCPAVLRVLAGRGADVSAPAGGLRHTPLFAAVAARQLACIATLIELGCDVDAGMAGCSPLWRAADQGDDEVVRLLLDAGADPYSLDARYQTLLAWTAKRGHLSTMEVLRSAMRDPDKRRSHLRSALRAAVYEQRLAVVRHIVERHPEVTEGPDALGEAIEGAAVRGNAEILRYLLSRGPCTLEGVGRGSLMGGETPLTKAVFKGKLEAVRVLLEAGANVWVRGLRGHTSLMVACCGAAAGAEHPQIIHLLLASGAEIDARASDGKTALMIAVENGRYGAAQALLSHRPDLSPRDQEGRTVFDLAREAGRPEMIALLAGHAG